MKLIFSLLVVSMLLLAGCSTNTDLPPEPETPGAAGNYYRAIGESFTESDTFSVNTDILECDPQSTEDISLEFAISEDAFVHNEMFIYDELSSSWDTFILSGESISGSKWLRGDASITYDKTCEELLALVDENNELFATAYSCSRDSTGFDCNDNKWQLQIIKVNEISAVADELSQEYCVDSDDGIDSYVKGSIESSTFAAGGATGDTCVDIDTLEEMYCDGTVATSELIPCDFGCFDGACATLDSPDFETENLPATAEEPSDDSSEQMTEDEKSRILSIFDGKYPLFEYVSGIGHKSYKLSSVGYHMSYGAYPLSAKGDYGEQLAINYESPGGNAKMIIERISTVSESDVIGEFVDDMNNDPVYVKSSLDGQIVRGLVGDNPENPVSFSWVSDGFVYTIPNELVFQREVARAYLKDYPSDLSSEGSSDVISVNLDSEYTYDSSENLLALLEKGKNTLTQEQTRLAKEYGSEYIPYGDNFIVLHQEFVVGSAMTSYIRPLAPPVDPNGRYAAIKLYEIRYLTQNFEGKPATLIVYLNKITDDNLVEWPYDAEADRITYESNGYRYDFSHQGGREFGDAILDMYLERFPPDKIE